jgi:very-short-patch-repair endonuclease
MEDDSRWGVDAPLELWTKLKPLARQMRREPTLAEQKVWHFLRQRSASDYKFRQQHVSERFIVDFYCAKAHLVIEVDGHIHDYTATEDAIRQEYLEALGLRVIRFTNAEVLNDIDDVLRQIYMELHE